MTSDNIVCIPSAVKMPIMTLPTKTVLIKLEHGVILFSPSSGLEEHRERIDSFGEVTDIVAPNLYHNLGVSGAKALYPKANLWPSLVWLIKSPIKNGARS